MMAAGTRRSARRGRIHTFTGYGQPVEGGVKPRVDVETNPYADDRGGPDF